MGDEKRSGCGLFNAFFGRRTIWPRRSTSTGSLPASNLNQVTRSPSTPKNRKIGFDHKTILKDRKQADTIVARRAGQNNPKSPPANRARNQQGHGQGRKCPQPVPGISGELETMITDYQKSNGHGNLVRASSSNVMLYGNLGNLRQSGNNNNNNNGNVMSPTKGKQFPTSGMGNVVVKKNIDGPGKPVSLCRALSTRMDPEQLKILGNEDYKNGRFAEALALYDAAISIDPNKASYRSNKSAALVALGKLLEAAFECREAIRIDPFYQRAHNRLATIYVRLGEAERAVYHFKQAGSEADPDFMNKAKKVQFHLNKCTEAKRQRDWNSLLKETGFSIAAGADSAPLIFGLRAEALLRLNRQEEATEIMEKGPNFDIEDCMKFFGPIGSSSLLLFRAQVDLVAGRFDDAMTTAQRACRLDPNNKEANLVLRRTKVVSTARTNGNELFKVARYSEAVIAYGEGLSCDPYNARLVVQQSRLQIQTRSIRKGDRGLKIRAGKKGSQDMNHDEVNAAGMVVVSSNERFRDYVTSPGTSVVLFSKKPGDRTIMQLIEQLNQRYPSVNFLKVEVEDHPSLAKSEGLITPIPYPRAGESSMRPIAREQR
ncbi:hypothetical protein DH2020_015195 [Rehmannia glutinosa]|uniref:Uncharacterized protein n=1 Tax=Rehmannia glutinosa TaxID=99300 RepID=A0ABR0WRX5_REHGL